MSDNLQSANLTIQAVKPVGYFRSLLQSLGRLVILGIATIAMMALGIQVYTAQLTGGGLDGLLVGDLESSGPGGYVTVEGDHKAKTKFLALDLSGVILGTPPYPVQDPSFYAMYNVTFGYQLRDQILAAADDPSIAGLFIHAQTPGGTIFGSEAIHEGIATYQEKTGNPVLVWVEGMSASGGVYSTAGADAIYAAPGSSVGSIGVIGGAQVYYNNPTALQPGLNAGGVTTKDGIEVTYLHAGRGKDAGNPFRRATPEEIAIRQGDLDRAYAEFVRRVAEGRHVERDLIVETMGAHLYGNEQAADYGLIDGTLSRDDAYKALATLAGLDESASWQIVRRSPPRQSILTDVLAEDSAKAAVFAQVVKTVETAKCNASQQVSLVYNGSFDDFCNGLN